MKLGRSEGKPANDAEHSWRSLGQIQQPLCFLNSLSRLNRKGASYACLRDNTVKVVHEKVPSQRMHAVRNPGELVAVVVPEMVMCIDPERLRNRALRKHTHLPRIPLGNDLAWSRRAASSPEGKTKLSIFPGETM